jgi:hypothetical protein
MVNCRLPTDAGGVAQLARASALQAEGHRFDSVHLHYPGSGISSFDILDVTQGLKVRNLDICKTGACRSSSLTYWEKVVNREIFICKWW